jgi:hypothetical protein
MKITRAKIYIHAYIHTYIHTERSLSCCRLWELKYTYIHTHREREREREGSLVADYESENIYTYIHTERSVSCCRLCHHWQRWLQANYHNTSCHRAIHCWEIRYVCVERVIFITQCESVCVFVIFLLKHVIMTAAIQLWKHECMYV